MAGLSVRERVELEKKKKKKRKAWKETTTTTTRFPFGIAVEYFRLFCFFLVTFCVRVKLFGKIPTQQLRLALADLAGIRNQIRRVH